MKLVTGRVLLLILLSGLFIPQLASAEHSQHHNAVKICKKRYKDTVRGSKYLPHREREARIEQAKRELRQCIDSAPR